MWIDESDIRSVTFGEYIDLGHGAKVIRSQQTPQGDRSLPAVKIDPETTAFIQHSAGTTGLQKGVALSHGAVLRQLDHLCAALKVHDDDRIYSWLPLYH